MNLLEKVANLNNQLNENWTDTLLQNIKKTPKPSTKEEANKYLPKIFEYLRHRLLDHTKDHKTDAIHKKDWVGLHQSYQIYRWGYFKLEMSMDERLKIAKQIFEDVVKKTGIASIVKSKSVEMDKSIRYDSITFSIELKNPEQ
jgi:hypothetical protein